jgi:hypothetical protein
MRRQFCGRINLSEFEPNLLHGEPPVRQGVSSDPFAFMGTRIFDAPHTANHGTKSLLLNKSEWLASSSRSAAIDVRYWHKADIQLSRGNVRFWG